MENYLFALVIFILLLVAVFAITNDIREEERIQLKLDRCDEIARTLRLEREASEPGLREENDRLLGEMIEQRSRQERAQQIIQGCGRRGVARQI